jgi:hypothetical protein
MHEQFSMNKKSSPVVIAHRMERPVSHHRSDMEHAFKAAEPIPLLQNFPGGNFEANPTGLVHVGWSGTSLHLIAELEDDHIVTRATRFNESIYLLGDCFEIFLQRKGEPQYLELHVAPNNIVLQLLYPSYADFAQYRKLPEKEFIDRFAVKEPAFASQVWAEPHEQRWTVAASIDLRILVPELATLADEEWRFNFSRYDYPATGGRPILSSTSVLRALNFHLQEDWGTLHFRS